MTLLIHPPVCFPSSNVGAYATHTYYDGFGRPIQTRDLYHDVDGVTGQQDWVTLVGYHANGQANCQSTQYAVDHYTVGVITDLCTTKTHTTTSYDDLGRVTSVETPADKAQSTDTSYEYYVIDNPLDATLGKVSLVNVFDANGHGRGQVTDARGQLIQVIDFSGNTPGDLCPLWLHQL